MERNIELLNRVADHVEAHPESFDMGTYFSSCGTTACIAGWSWRLETNLDPDWIESLSERDYELHFGHKSYYPEIARNIWYYGPSVLSAYTFGKVALGLDEKDAAELFYADINNVQAAAVLRTLATEPRTSAFAALERVGCQGRI